jgi:hypothetical protein
VGCRELNDSLELIDIAGTCEGDVMGLVVDD